MLGGSLAVVAATVSAVPAGAQVAKWPVHSLERPAPPVVQPAPADRPAEPPADAVVLFGGNGLGEWARPGGGAAPWRDTAEFMEVVPGSGSIVSRRAFGSSQVHVEWMAPLPAEGEGQDRGNSGVFLMNRYEIQVLDSWQNPTYADGQAGAVYGQYPPLVNASRAPGEWQSYDIIFHRPRFDESGAVETPARITLFHNGVLVQDNVTLTGPVGHGARPPYEAHADRLPLGLQDHGRKVRFRNVWVRELPERGE